MGDLSSYEASALTYFLALVVFTPVFAAVVLAGIYSFETWKRDRRKRREARRVERLRSWVH